MSQRVSLLVPTCLIFTLVITLSSVGYADWSETFADKTFDLSTWEFPAYPQYTDTFKNAIETNADGDSYMVIEETSPASGGGAAFGLAVGSPESFKDVRIGAVVNAAGAAAQNYVGLAARTTYFVDDGSLSGHPGAVASTYLMLIHYQEGPGNLRIEVFKSFNLSNDGMQTYHEINVSEVDDASPRYAELDVVGSDPVYITGSLYAFKGGPLLARTPTMIDTAAADPWENAGPSNAVYAEGVSAVFSMNESDEPIGFKATFGDISSVTITPADMHVKDLAVDDFESYTNDGEIAVAWICNIPDFGYVSLNEDGNDEQLRLQFQNQYEPYVTEAALTPGTPQDWTIGGVSRLSLSFRGQVSNVAQPMSIVIEDSSGAQVTVLHPSVYGVQSKFWRTWDIDLNVLEGIDLTAVKSMTIRVGNGTDSGQQGDDSGEVLINTIVLN
jgi:hypothetical protein